MSDDYINVIPEDPRFVPAQEKLQDAVLYFRDIAPQSHEISSSVTNNLEFVQCGANFEKIFCPKCGAEFAIDSWQMWMDQDYGDNGFTLNLHSMPCCGAQHTLHDLTYDWLQGFARATVSAMNPNIGKLSSEQHAKFEMILGCPVRVIYEHL